MKPYKVVFRKTALADLRAIFSYVLEKSGSRKTALNYVKRIQRKCDEIGTAPLAYVERPDIFPELRMAVFERRIVILYVVQKTTVRITSVQSGSRDYEVLVRPPTSSPPP
ncbi:type II toxin-antitoxin system RelE/ParE family toxin [Pararhizobium sp. O133]|uniref:type II toxin-antitoxin system RelE/ParE family toxin n=1 Tax=Pararhizobium sp. O133 TaxID=3449278 RepID=UPI003F683A72